MSENMGSPGMFEAEANDPGFVYRHGWLTLGCPDCGEYVYDGRLISEEDKQQLVVAHNLACQSAPTPLPPRRSLWQRLLGGTTP